MKKIIITSFYFVFFITLISCGDTSNDESGTEKSSLALKERRYGLKSAIVEYDVSGSQEGTRRLYFDNWGLRQAEYSNTTITIGQFSKTANLVNINDGEWQYIINMETKSGTKSQSQLKELKTQLEGEQYFNELGEQVILKMGGQKVGEEEYMEKECVIYEFRNIGIESMVLEMDFTQIGNALRTD